MKKTNLLKITALIGFALLSPLHAEDDVTPLGETMDEASSALKSLRRLDDGDWEAKVAAARTAQKAMIVGLQHEPAMFAGIKDEAAKTLASADYRMQIAQGYVLLCQLETAYLKKDEEAAKAVLQKLKDLKKSSHEKYIED